MTICNSTNHVRKQLIGSIAIAGSLCTQTALAPMSARAATAPKALILLAQQQNARIATLQCGAYTIVINTQGTADKEVYTYRTKGLFLRDGTRDGEDYIFNNNDYEYRVTTRGGGSGRLTVSHYGERILTKQCTCS